MINSVDAVNFERKHAFKMLEIRDRSVPATSVDAVSLQDQKAPYLKKFTHFYF